MHNKKTKELILLRHFRAELARVAKAPETGRELEADKKKRRLQEPQPNRVLYFLHLIWFLTLGTSLACVCILSATSRGPRIAHVGNTLSRTRKDASGDRNADKGNQGRNDKFGI